MTETQQKKVRMPSEVAGMRWWKETRRQYFAKVKDYADDYARAFAQPDMRHLSQVRLFDTTPRDGMQMSRAFVPSGTSPKTIMKNKLSIIAMLAKMEVPIIEAGFAAASQDEIDIIRSARRIMERRSFGTKIVALGRTVRGDIDAIVRSEADIAHIFSSGSAPHTWIKFGKQPKDILPDIKDAVAYAKQCGFREIVLSLEDAARADPEHVAEVGRIARDIAGDAVRYNIPDTVGVADPVHMFALIRYLDDKVGIPLQVHCHNDRGLAAMNSIAAAVGGASEVHVTMHGIGERAGNAALEEVAGFMMTQFGVRMVNTEMFASVSNFVEKKTGIPRKINSPYVGPLAFWHESGVHGAAVKRGEQVGYNTREGIDGGSIYAAYSPGMVGKREEIGVGPLSGQTNVIWKMADFGIKIEDKEVATAIIGKVKERSATTAVSDADLVLIAYECTTGKQFEGIRVKDCKVNTCMNNGSEAVVEIKKGDEVLTGRAAGNGPIDAAISAVREIIGRDDVKVDDYDSKSVGKGSDAAANCTIRVKVNGKHVNSSEIDRNTVMAAVKAFEKGVNALAALEEMGAVQ